MAVAKRFTATTASLLVVFVGAFSGVIPKIKEKEVLIKEALVIWALGLITNLTNAKAGVFAVAFLPLFVPRDFSVGLGVAILGGIWAVVSALSYSAIIYGFDKAANKFTSPQAQRRLTIISGIGILVLALSLAIS